MPIKMSATEIRVLGALMEKQMTTPEYYPLTLSALMAACNQKSNRDPVMQLDRRDIMQALDALREKHFAWEVAAAGARVPKYRHDVGAVWPLAEGERAVLCGLLLRGPQTAGELRARTGRMHPFGSLEEVETTLRGLASRGEEPLVRRLAREPGRRECRYTHLLEDAQAARPTSEPEPPEPVSGPPAAADEPPLPESRLAALEEEVARLREEVLDIRQRVAGTTGEQA
jgi:uncharacterized protein YceH (UPF0502 family)